MKISILSHGFDGWGGGIDFLSHIASSIALSENRNALQKTLILPADDFVGQIKKCLYPFKAAAKHMLKGDIPKWVSRPGFSELYIRVTFAELRQDFDLVHSGSSYRAQLSVARRLAADIVLPCIEPPSESFSLPWIGYLYDFQHCHLPDFFTIQEIEQRNQSFARMLDKASHIIVNAQSVVQDAQIFYPGHKACIHRLPFSPCPQKSWLEDNTDVRVKYGIDRPYFIICNQFWKHKDHPTAFRAFARHLQHGSQALLVCTGQTSDYRFPQYSEELTHLLEELEITPRVRILGHIPKLEQIALLKHALAVLQPTLFEGGPGGGASYDAISMGIPVIASNIPVNLEMDCGNVSFFEAGNDQALADALHERGNKAYFHTDNEKLWQAGLSRRKHCGDVIVKIAQQTIRDYR